MMVSLPDMNRTNICSSHKLQLATDARCSSICHISPIPDAVEIR
jgi:hypothetical protein